MAEEQKDKVEKVDTDKPDASQKKPYRGFLRNKWTRIAAVGCSGLILMIWIAWAYLSP